MHWMHMLDAYNDKDKGGKRMMALSGFRDSRSTLAVLAVLISIALALLMAACGSSSTDEGTGAGTSSDGTPKSGGILRVSWYEEPQSLDPIVPSDNQSIWTIANLFEQLVRVNADGSGIEPGLATSWDVSEDGKTYTFHLREGAQFSDGSPVTAQDVEFSLNRARGENSNWSSLFAGIESVKALDDGTVNVSTKKPSAVLLAHLALFSASIVPEAAVEAQGEAFGESPIGSGPFMLSKWDRGVQVELEKNPYYWQEGKPYLDGAVFVRSPEDNSRVLQLQSGECDLARPIAFSALADVKSNPSLVVQTNPQLNSHIVTLNNEKAPFDDPLVRKAMNHATDKEGILKSVFAGNGSVSNGYLPQMPGWWDESLPVYEYNVEKAKDLLAQSSVPNGFSTELVFVSGDATNEATAVIIQENLAKIGIKVKLLSLDSGAEWEKLTRGDFEMGKDYGSSDILDPDQMTTFFVVLHDRAKSYWSRYYNADVERWAREAQTELDADKRHELYNQIQAQVNEDAPFIFLFYLPDSTVFQSYVKGFNVLPTGNWRMEDVWLDK